MQGEGLRFQWIGSAWINIQVVVTLYQISHFVGERKSSFNELAAPAFLRYKVEKRLRAMIAQQSNLSWSQKRAGDNNENRKCMWASDTEIIVYLSAMVRLWEGSREVLWSFQHCHSVSLSCSMSHNRAPCLSSSKAPQSWMECQKGLASPLESFEGQQWALPSLA